jgi:cation transport protein ChaC
MRYPLRLTPELVGKVERRVPQDDLPPDPRRVPMAEEDYAGELDAILKRREEGPLWVFAYGSLLWNPGFDFSERRTATLRGWHRAFCMEVRRFRGSPEQPGLMLALEHGGCCRGEAFLIPEPMIASQVGKLLRREIPYRREVRGWRFVTLDIAGRRRRALTFYAGMRGDAWHVVHDIHQQARMLARAAGHGGSGAYYLHRTVMALEALGIRDSYLWQLQHLVAAEIRTAHPGPPPSSGE